MKIKFTKKQYQNLQLLVNIGDFIINGHNLPDELDEDIRKLVDYINKKGNDFGIKNTTEHQNNLINQSFHLIDEYSKDDLFDNMVDALTERDFHRKYTEEQIKQMTPEEHYQKKHFFYDYRGKEFEENGFERLDIN